MFTCFGDRHEAKTHRASLYIATAFHNFLTASLEDNALKYSAQKHETLRDRGPSLRRHPAGRFRPGGAWLPRLVDGAELSLQRAHACSAGHAPRAVLIPQVQLLPHRAAGCARIGTAEGSLEGSGGRTKRATWEAHHHQVDSLLVSGALF